MEQHINNINQIIESGFKQVCSDCNAEIKMCSGIIGFNGGVIFVMVNLDDVTEARVTGYTFDEQTYEGILPIHVNSPALNFSSSKEGVKAHDVLFDKIGIYLS
jgi:hypothetical protein